MWFPHCGELQHTVDGEGILGGSRGCEMPDMQAQTPKPTRDHSMATATHDIPAGPRERRDLQAPPGAPAAARGAGFSLSLMLTCRQILQEINLLCPKWQRYCGNKAGEIKGREARR